jgi:phasin family protein
MKPIAQDQLLKVQQEHFDRLMSLSKVLLDSTEKMSAMNMANVKDQIESLYKHASKLAEAKSPKEWYELQVSYMKPSGAKAGEQATKTYELSKETAKEVAGIMENQVNQFNKSVNDAFGNFMKMLPQGAEPLSSAFNSLMAAGNNAYSAAQQAAKQAVALAEANVAAASKAAEGMQKK